MNDLIYSSTKKNYNFSNYSFLVVPLRDIYERRLSINDADKNIFYKRKKKRKS